VDWLFQRVAGGPGPPSLALAAGNVPAVASALAVVATPRPQPVDAGSAGTAADFVPGFGPRDHAPTAAESHVRKPWRQRLITAGKAR